MTAIRDFLLMHLGGTPFMWEVFLGVFLAMVAWGIVQFVIWIIARIFR